MQPEGSCTRLCGPVLTHVRYQDKTAARGRLYKAAKSGSTPPQRRSLNKPERGCTRLAGDTATTCVEGLIQRIYLRASFQRPNVCHCTPHCYSSRKPPRKSPLSHS